MKIACRGCTPKSCTPNNGKFMIFFRLNLFISKFKLSKFLIRNSESALELFNKKPFFEKFFREMTCPKGGSLIIDSPEYLTQVRYGMQQQEYFCIYRSAGFIYRRIVQQNIYLAVDELKIYHLQLTQNGFLKYQRYSIFFGINIPSNSEANEKLERIFIDDCAERDANCVGFFRKSPYCGS